MIATSAVPMAFARLTALGRKLGREFAWYLAISVIALAIDFALFLGLTTTGWRPGLAAAAGWTVGLLVHYLLARRFLYIGIERGGRLPTRISRFLNYALPSVVGLAITVLVVEVGAALGFAPTATKALATVLSFGLAFVARSLMFRGSES